MAAHLGTISLEKFHTEWEREPDPNDDDDMGYVVDMWNADWDKLRAGGVPDEDYGWCHRQWYDMVISPGQKYKPRY